MFLLSTKLFNSLEGFLLDEFDPEGEVPVELAGKGVDPEKFHDVFHGLLNKEDLAKKSKGFTAMVEIIMSSDDLAKKFCHEALADTDSDSDSDSDVKQVIEPKAYYYSEEKTLVWARSLEEKFKQIYAVDYSIAPGFMSYLKNRHSVKVCRYQGENFYEITPKSSNEIVLDLQKNVKQIKAWREYRGTSSSSPFSDCSTSLSSKRSSPDTTTNDSSDSEDSCAQQSISQDMKRARRHS